MYRLSIIIFYKMANPIPIDYIVVVQKAQGAMSPQEQLQLGPVRSLELHRHREAADNCVYAHDVAAKPAEVITRGVQVVLDVTKPEHYQEMRNED